MPNKIKWIFFDVGGVIVDEDFYLKKYYRRLLEEMRRCRIKITKKEFEGVRQKAIEEYQSSITMAILNKLIKDERIREKIRKKTQENLRKEIDDLIKLKKNIKRILKALIEKGYKLGLIANQGKEMIDFLKKHNLWELFDFRGISEILGLRKPDLRIFKLALKGGCKPNEAIMVGDRIENDIIPAKKLGMKTIRIRKGGFEHSNQEPKNKREKADITIKSINQLIKAIDALVYKK